MKKYSLKFYRKSDKLKKVIYLQTFFHNKFRIIENIQTDLNQLQSIIFSIVKNLEFAYKNE